LLALSFVLVLSTRLAAGMSMTAVEAAPRVVGGSATSPALKHAVLARCSTSDARVCSLELPHNKLELPIFMPVGTAAAVKGLTVEEMEALEVPLILGNTYHLALRPTTELLDDCGGLHKFMGWRRAMLTDSGGFQMVSLLKLANITEEGVTFQSPSDGSKMLLTPEKSIQLQNEIGADIMMALDDVVSSTTPSRERVEEVMSISMLHCVCYGVRTCRLGLAYARQGNCKCLTYMHLLPVESEEWNRKVCARCPL